MRVSDLVDNCEGVTCEDWLTCVDGVGSHTCECDAGFSLSEDGSVCVIGKTAGLDRRAVMRGGRVW